MRAATYILALSVLTGCGSGDALEPGVGGLGDGHGREGGGGRGVGGVSEGSPGMIDITACPTGVPAAAHVATDTNATGVQVAGDYVYFQVGPRVARVGRDGVGRAEIYYGEYIVRAWADDTALLVVESPAPPAAVLRVSDLGAGDDMRAKATTLDAASTRVFASDATRFFLVTTGKTGDDIHSLDKKSLDLKKLTSTGGAVTDAQIVDGALWYVRDGSRVFTRKLDEEAAPSEIFGLGAGSCRLAVAAGSAFCSAGASIEQRELTGKNPRTVLEADRSTQARAPFGAALYAGGELLVRSTDPTLGAILRSIRVAWDRVDESLVACGRPEIEAVAADDRGIAWVEPGRGVFHVARR